jgi:hypothetical protein
LVAFSEPVTPTFDASDVTLTGSLASAATFQLSGTDPNYAVTVTITDPLADGTIGIQIGGPVSDPALNPYAGGSSPVCRIHNWFGFNLHPQTAYAYEGESHVFSVGASFGESIPAYVWQWDDGMKTIQTVGGDSPTYTIPNVAGKAGKYWCQLTYDGTTYSSNQATLYVAPPVHITQQPQSQTKLIGEACEFNVLATGGFAPLTYEWLKDGVTVSTSTDSTYSIDQVGWNDAGTYRVVVTDTQSGTATSNSVQLVAGQNMPATRLAGLTVLILAFAFLGYRRIAVLRK